jgi:predicted methyltransferase
MEYDNKTRIIGNFMDELCKKHRDAINNGTSTKFQITSIYNRYLEGFDRKLVDKVLKEYTEEGLISIDNDFVELTKTGKQFCSEKVS